MEILGDSIEEVLHKKEKQQSMFPHKHNIMIVFVLLTSHWHAQETSKYEYGYKYTEYTVNVDGTATFADLGATIPRCAVAIL